MRKLTVKRNKSFVGCSATIHIYIEEEGGEITVGGVPCRELGEVKNGSEASFEIDCSARRVFAIADKLSKDYCNDCYRIEEGEEDIELRGQCRFNPAAGNAFRFDGNDNADSAANRRSGVRKGLTVLLISIVIGAVLGYTVTSIILGINSSKEKVFYVSDMSITLTNGFTQESVPGFTAAYNSKNVAVFVTRESYSSDNVYADLSVEEYADLVIEANGFTDIDVITEDGLTYFTFNAENDDNENYRYYAYTYKTEKAFWLIQFSVEETDAGKYEGEIKNWAASVKFGQ